MSPYLQKYALDTDPDNEYMQAAPQGNAEFEYNNGTPKSPFFEGKIFEKNPLSSGSEGCCEFNHFEQGLKAGEPSPLLYIDINISDNRAERISVFEGDTPERLALDFVAKHGLSTNMHSKLLNLLRQQMVDIDQLRDEKLS